MRVGTWLWVGGPSGERKSKILRDSNVEVGRNRWVRVSADVQLHDSRITLGGRLVLHRLSDQLLPP